MRLARCVQRALAIKARTRPDVSSGRASTSDFVPARKTWMAGTSPATTMSKQRLHSGHSSYAIALHPRGFTRIAQVSGRSPSAVEMDGCWNSAGDLPDESKRFRGQASMPATAIYFAWGCFRYFGVSRVECPLPRPACGERSDRIDRCDPGEGDSPRVRVGGESPSPQPSQSELCSSRPRKSGARERTFGAAAA